MCLFVFFYKLVFDANKWHWLKKDCDKNSLCDIYAEYDSYKI